MAQIQDISLWTVPLTYDVSVVLLHQGKSRMAATCALPLFTTSAYSHSVPSRGRDSNTTNSIRYHRSTGYIIRGGTGGTLHQ